MTAPWPEAAAALEVIDGGFATTIQDAGRPEWTHLGVPVSGAADPWSLAVANLLIGNDPGAAALEMALTGPTVLMPGPVTIGLAGADLGARIEGGRHLAPGRSHRLSAGEILTFTGDPTAGPTTGWRGYLAVPGGFDVPIVLGSRSTCLAAGFGGLDGRPLRGGDVLAVAAGGTGSGGGAGSRGDAASGRAGLVRPELAWPAPDGGGISPGAPAPTVLLVLAGPMPGIDALVGREWRVSSAADRVGVRLDGDPLPSGIGGETTTHGVPWGAIQVPPDGRPIILGADHQVTGGYRVVGVVISADLPALGQLRPGAPLRLVATTLAEAHDALRARAAALAAGAAALREAAGWGALIDAAGS